MGPNRADRESELGRDLGVASALGDEAKDLGLARRQRRVLGSPAPADDRRRLVENDVADSLHRKLPLGRKPEHGFTIDRIALGVVRHHVGESHQRRRLALGARTVMSGHGIDEPFGQTPSPGRCLAMVSG